MKSKKRLFYITQYAAMLRNGRLLLLRDTDCDGTHPALKGKWIFPGGHIDTELDPIKALKREIKEELDMKLKSAFPIRTEIKLYPTGYRFVVYYRTEAAGKIRLSEEHDAYKWVSLKDVKKMRFRDAQEKNVVEDILRSRQ
jgi:8-oxo-dGTP diphosphatase